MTKNLLFFLLLFICMQTHAQDVAIYKQFGGRIDFTMFGNTLNRNENGLSSDCVINTSSAANFQLNNTDTIIAAYLYWAGSGDGDLEVKLNNQSINATRVFRDTLQSQNLNFFSAFKDVTEQITTTGNATYTLSDLDITSVIPDYCTNATNFAGWTILVIYENENLPLNQINVYDGLQHVPTELNITLDNLNVIDNTDAKIGFLAWEGDKGLSVNETLLINNNLISNPPLNPSDNAFNGTNSFTNESDLHNMDMDFYNIQNNIAIGDTTATVSLTSGQDFVMINTIITKLNSQLPDATVNIDSFTIPDCTKEELLLSFTVKNENSTHFLPANTSIKIYRENTLITSLSTSNIIPINQQESFEILLLIPLNLRPSFNLTIVVDEENSVLEISDTNNTANQEILFPTPPAVIQIPPLNTCNEGFNSGSFNLTETTTFLQENYQNTTHTFFNSEEDLNNNTDEINPLIPYQNPSNSQTLFIKTIDNLTGCSVINTVDLIIENCPPTIYNVFTPNGDNFNEVFFIKGLKNIFTKYQLFVFNRYGRTVYKGTNNTPFWNGKINNTEGNLPSATYFYVLELNDNSNKTFNGWLHLER